VKWLIWGNAPEVFEDQLTMRIVRAGWTTPDTLIVDYSIKLLPQGGPYTGAETSITIGKGSAPAVPPPPKAPAKPQSQE
jgi:hypothetical protein